MSELTKEERAALIKIMEMKNQLMDMEFQSIYLRGYYDSVVYLKKQEFYNRQRRHWGEADAVLFA